MNKTLWIGIGLLVAVGAVAGYLLYGKGGGAPSTNPYGVARTVAPLASASPEVPGATKQIAVSGGEYSFSPSSLSLNKGDQVTLTFKNTGKLPHNLTIDELRVATKTIGPEESDTVTFTVDKSGTFSFYCSVDAHRSLGMEGKLKAQ